jgi:acyl dehydratase
MQAAVGTEFRWLTSYPVSGNEIRRWAMAIYYPDDPPRLFWDDAYATTTPFGGIVAPEDFNPFAWSMAEPTLDSHFVAITPWPEPELGLPLPPARANILNELGVTYTGVRIRPGDVVRSATSLTGYREREGKMGLTLYTTLEDRWTNQRGELLRTSRSSVIRYR